MNRLELLQAQASTGLNGIDFVEVETGQTTLNVYFINPPLTAFQGALINAPLTTITITGGESIPTVAVTGASWITLPVGVTVLQLTVAQPGDFSSYTLALPPGSLVDPFFGRSVFSFKAACPSTLDCAPPAAPCPPPVSNAPPIEYLAKDYQSFRGALLDFSSLRYPAWQERNEGDFGVMFAEALASLGDDLSYLQDRIGAEAYIETATERRSLVRLARLLNYEPMPATAATVVLQLNCGDGTVPAGAALSTVGPDGNVLAFQVGTGLADNTPYGVKAIWSAIAPYMWDESVACLLAGATEMWLTGQNLELSVGQQLLIDTAPAVAGDPPLREIVTILAGGQRTEVQDPLASGTPWVTHVTFAAPLQMQHDLTRTTCSANLVPANQGMVVHDEAFLISDSGGPQAIVRTGPNGTTQYLYTLANAPLAWLQQPGDPMPLPEIQVTGPVPGGTTGSWAFTRSLLQAGPFDLAFTIDPMRYVSLGPVTNADGTSLTLQDGVTPVTAVEYDSDAGDTIRFGDASFGAIPPIPTGGATFQVTYCVGGGAAGNIASGATFSFTSAALSTHGFPNVIAVTNPFAATGGSDPESDESIRRRAPYAYRNNVARAPLAADFEQYAKQLPWVSRANTLFRFTGSWLTAVTAPEPAGSAPLSVMDEIQLLQVLDRVRMAGRDSLVRPADYVSLDIAVVVCAIPDAYRADVEVAILAALSAQVLPGGAKGFFHPDNFGFGQALRPRTLEAAVQVVPGVAGVLGLIYRRRNAMTDYSVMNLDLPIAVAPWEIIQVDSDPNRPDHGTVQVFVEGGK